MDLSRNKIHMKMDQILSILNPFTFPYLMSLDLSYNNLFGGVDFQFPFLYSISLSHNNLTGPITPILKLPKTIMGIKLEFNSFTGPIPTLSASFINLKILEIGNNHLIGTLPDMPLSLVSLGLQENRLFGTIPTQWEHLSNLVTINLEGNHLCGCLPPKWNKFSLDICTLGEMHLDCNCELPVNCRHAPCDPSVKSEACGINQCKSQNQCHSPRECVPKTVVDGYYVGFECTNCSDSHKILTNYGDLECAIIYWVWLTPTLVAFVCILAVSIYLFITKYMFLQPDFSLLPFPWFWDTSRLKRTSYTKVNSNPVYYYRKLAPSLDKEFNLLESMIHNLDFEDIIITQSYAISSPNLAYSLQTALQIQRARLSSNDKNFFSQDWRNKTKFELRKSARDMFLKQCLNWSWNSDLAVEDGFILPVVHGTDEEKAWKIAQNGFASLSILDDGFYGRGMYFTTSAAYTLQYIAKVLKPTILICLIIPGNPFPVVEDPSKPGTYRGSCISTGYQSHYCRTSFLGLPYKEKDLTEKKKPYDEIVLNQESQVLPLFLLLISSKNIINIIQRRREEVS
uniref:PARP catalytic domain-containing protein n=1 Tax=Arcella intermedia TaxID=1963864 RepID=A0A6B2L0J1_9EUKA